MRPVRTQIPGFEDLEPLQTGGSSLAQCLGLLLHQKQIYADVPALLEQGMAVWEICRQELKESCILIPGCGLRMVLYYVGRQSPVMGITDTGDAVLIVGYDAQNIICYDASRGALNRMGIKDSTVMFEAAGNLFFTYTP